MTPDGEKAAGAASIPWQAEGEISIIDTLIMMSFYHHHHFNSPKQVLSLWILEDFGDPGRTFDQEGFPHLLQMSWRQTGEELGSLEEAPSV